MSAHDVGYDRMQAEIRVLKQSQPKADVFISSYVNYHNLMILSLYTNLNNHRVKLLYQEFQVIVSWRDQN